MLRAGFVYNETKKEYVACLQKYKELKAAYRSDTSLAAKLDAAERSMQLAGKNMKRWEERWIKTRPGHVVFLYFFLVCECRRVGRRLVQR